MPTRESSSSNREKAAVMTFRLKQLTMGRTPLALSLACFDGIHLRASAPAAAAVVGLPSIWRSRASISMYRIARANAFTDMAAIPKSCFGIADVTRCNASTIVAISALGTTVGVEAEVDEDEEAAAFVASGRIVVVPVLNCAIGFPSVSQA